MTELMPRNEFDNSKIAQFEAIQVVKDCECPECHKSDISGFLPCDRAKPIGWCETQTGFMAIFECPKCFTKFRCHINTAGRYNIESFYSDYSLMWFLYND